MSMELVNGYVQKMDQFGSVHTFVTLNEGADPDDVAAKLLDKYCEYWDFFERDASNGSILHGSSLTRLDEVYFSGMESYDFIRVGNIQLHQPYGGSDWKESEGNGYTKADG